MRGTIPVWVIGAWFAPRSMRRAAGRDGVLPIRRENGFDPLTPETLREISTWVGEQRGGQPFELVVEGVLPADRGEAADTIAALEDAGVTWWIDSDWDFDTVTADGLLERIRRGPLPA